jgi:hypothetical protein
VTGAYRLGDACRCRGGHEGVGPNLADHVAGDWVLEAAGPFGEAEERLIGVPEGVASTFGADDVGREGEAALVEQPADADGPAVVNLPNAVVVGDADVGEELLAERVLPLQGDPAVYCLGT